MSCLFKKKKEKEMTLALFTSNIVHQSRHVWNLSTMQDVNEPVNHKISFSVSWVEQQKSDCLIVQWLWVQILMMPQPSRISKWQNAPSPLSITVTVDNCGHFLRLMYEEEEGTYCFHLGIQGWNYLQYALEKERGCGSYSFFPTFSLPFRQKKIIV